MHPEPGLERNGKTKEENKEDAQKKLFTSMKKERELGGLMNVKNEDKVGKDLDKIPSLKQFDADNGLTSKEEEKTQAKKALAQQEHQLMDDYEVNFDELARNIPARSESEYDGEYV